MFVDITSGSEFEYPQISRLDVVVFIAKARFYRIYSIGRTSECQTLSGTLIVAINTAISTCYCDYGLLTILTYVNMNRRICYVELLIR